MPKTGEVTEGFEYKWNDGTSTYRVRVHGPDSSAPEGSNARNGWVVRIQKGHKYYDPVSGEYCPSGATNPNSPNYNETTANDTHIPIVEPEG